MQAPGAEARGGDVLEICKSLAAPSDTMEKLLFKTRNQITDDAVRTAMKALSFRDLRQCMHALGVYVINRVISLHSHVIS
jgi:hypothetical protein